MPLVILLDPHGSGNYAIQKFIKSAERYKCILVASHIVRNNFSDFVPSLETLIADVRSKYPVGDKIYLAGFSGGARMAISLAQIHKVNGVLACGAFAHEEEIKFINTNLFALFGMDDFNFYEVANFFLDPTGYPSNIKIEIIGGIHEWPSAEYLENALGLLLITDFQKESECIKRKTLFNVYASDNKKRVDSLIKAHNYLNSWLVCSNIKDLKNLPDNSYFSSVYNSVNKSTELQNQIRQLKVSMQIEFKARDAYFKALNTQDNKWWANEIAILNAQIDSEKDVYKNSAYKRIRSFLGIMCYTMTNSALQANDLQKTKKMLELYKLVEPQNPDMFYFSALFFLKTGRTDSILSYLKSALKTGFNDLNALRNNFPPEIVSQVPLNNLP
jgi:uncharacterized protein YeeX (DUF496 family)